MRYVGDAVCAFLRMLRSLVKAWPRTLLHMTPATLKVLVDVESSTKKEV